MDFTQLITASGASGTATVPTPNKPAGEMPAGEFLALIQAGLQQAREAQTAQPGTQQAQNLHNSQTVCVLVEPAAETTTDHAAVAVNAETAVVPADTELIEAESLPPETQAPVPQSLPALWEAMFRQQLEPTADEVTDPTTGTEASEETAPEETALPLYSWSAVPAQSTQQPQANAIVTGATPQQTAQAAQTAQVPQLPQVPQAPPIPQAQAADMAEQGQTEAAAQTAETMPTSGSAQGIKIPAPFTAPEPQNIQLSQSWLDQLQVLGGKALTYQSMQTLQTPEMILAELSPAVKGLTAEAATDATSAGGAESLPVTASGLDFSGHPSGHNQSYTASGERLEFSAPADTSATQASRASAQTQTSELAERIALVRQLSDRIQLLHHARQRSIQLTLNPAHLGKVSLRLQQDAQQLQLHILTELPMAKELIESQIQQLRQQFQQQGLDLQQITIEVNPEHQAFQESASDQQDPQAGQGNHHRQGPEFSLTGALTGPESLESPPITVNPFSDGAAVNTLA